MAPQNENTASADNGNQPTDAPLYGSTPAPSAVDSNSKYAIDSMAKNERTVANGAKEDFTPPAGIGPKVDSGSPALSRDGPAAVSQL